MVRQWEEGEINQLNELDVSIKEMTQKFEIQLESERKASSDLRCRIQQMQSKVNQVRTKLKRIY